VLVVVGAIATRPLTAARAECVAADAAADGGGQPQQAPLQFGVTRPADAVRHFAVAAAGGFPDVAVGRQFVALWFAKAGHYLAPM
jgi:hypothetical protein